MQITNLGFGFGNAVQGKRFTITWNDLVGTAATTATQALFSFLRGAAFQERSAELKGYDVSQSGQVRHLN